MQPNAQPALNLFQTIRDIDAMSSDALSAIDRLAAGVLSDAPGLSAAVAAALDSVRFLAQSLANDINARAEMVGADARLALG